jgi:hypothetical protein
MRSVHKVLIEVEAKILPNVGYPQGIYDWQLLQQPIY